MKYLLRDLLTTRELEGLGKPEDLFVLLEPEQRNEPVSIKHGLRTTDYGLRTGYKTRTEV